MQLLRLSSTLSFRTAAAILVVELAVLGIGGSWLIGGVFREMDNELQARAAIPGLLMQQGALALHAASERAVMQALVGERLVQAALVGTNGIALHGIDESNIGRLVMGESGQPVTISQKNYTSHWGRVNGRDCLVAIAPIFPEHSPTPIFYLVLTMDASELNASKQQLILKAVAAILAAVAMTTAIILMVLRREVLLPVRIMAAAVQRIGSGQLSARSQSSAVGELSVLEGGLNAMAQSIQVNDLAIRASNLDLEEKYRARTKELETELGVRRRTESALCDARDAAERALEAKSRFLSAASHDLRQPVHALRLLNSALAEIVEEGGVDDEVAELVTEMGAAVSFLTEALNTLLDVSRLDAGIVVPAMGECQMSTILHDIAHQFQRIAATNGVQLTVVTGSATILSDSVLLMRVAANLVANAIKFAKGGRVLVGCRNKGAFVELQVWDTGIGIPANMTEEIFDEFKQIHNDARQQAKGLGLGLAIVKRTAALLGHGIRLVSAEGRGSMFAIRIARAPGQGGAVPPTPVSHGEWGRIVVLDDDPQVLMATRLLLRRWGAQVETFGDIATALQACAAPPWPQIIIADYRLPGALTGMDFIAQLRAMSAMAVPAILITGDSQLPDVTGLDNIVALPKPLDAQGLADAFQRVCTNQAPPVQV